MLKLEILKLLNPELFFDGPNFYKFTQLHEAEEDQAVILEK